MSSAYEFVSSNKSFLRTGYSCAYAMKNILIIIIIIELVEKKELISLFSERLG